MLRIKALDVPSEDRAKFGELLWHKCAFRHDGEWCWRRIEEKVVAAVLAKGQVETRRSASAEALGG